MSYIQCSGCTPGCWLCSPHSTRTFTTNEMRYGWGWSTMSSPPPPAPRISPVEQKLDEVIALLKQLLEAKR